MTKHSCGGPTFGRLAPNGECARCDELRAGAPVRQWAGRPTKPMRTYDHIPHDCTKSHCGIVCTFGDW